jgi:hypothetical protein
MLICSCPLIEYRESGQRSVSGEHLLRKFRGPEVRVKFRDLLEAAKKVGARVVTRQVGQR